MFKEFKEFASRGNVMDLAIGIIIGGAFQKIVTSLVGDIISPLLGLFSNANFENHIFRIGETEIRYGAFITTVIDFLIMAFVIFLMIKVINRITGLTKKPEVVEEAEPTTKQCPYCYSEIDIRATKCSHCASEIKE